MGRWRVGTLTMGVSLIVLGVVLLISLIGQYTIANHMMNLWPIGLITIGCEILFYIYKNKNGEMNIHYDFFSMIMIFIIFLVSMGIYGFSASGVIQRLTSHVSSNTYTVPMPQASINVDANIHKIVVKVLDRADLQIEPAQSSQLSYRGNGEVFASSREDAEAFINENLVNTEVVEGVLYVEFMSQWRENDLTPGVNRMEYTVFMPAGVTVEIQGKSGYYATEVTVRDKAIQADWSISQAHQVTLEGSGASNFVVEAVANGEGAFIGSQLWELTEIKGEQDGGGYQIGRASFGEETYQVTIMDVDYVETMGIP